MKIADFLQAIESGKPVHPDFYDGMRCQQVLDAVGKSAEKGCWINIAGE